MNGGIPDQIIIAKLQFFSYIAGIIKLFVTGFQGDKPMLPYMCGDIKLLQLAVKPSILANCNTIVKLLKLDLDQDENLLPQSKIHLGFAAENQINKHSNRWMKCMLKPCVSKLAILLLAFVTSWQKDAH